MITRRGCKRNSDHRRTTVRPHFLGIHIVLTGDFTHVRRAGLGGRKVLTVAFISGTSCSGVRRRSVLSIANLMSFVPKRGLAIILRRRSKAGRDFRIRRACGRRRVN